MSYTPFNAPLLAGFLGDHDLARFFSVKADLDAMLLFEVELARAQGQTGVIPSGTADQIAAAAIDFTPDVAKLGETSARDGLVVPEFVRQFRETIVPPHGEYLHFGSTSQDVIDTSLILRLKNVNAILVERLNELLGILERLDEQFGTRTLMGRTRMQSALPITVADRISTWVIPLKNGLRRYEQISQSLYQLQFGGPVGTLEKLDGRGPMVRKFLAGNLELNDPERCWHTDRSTLVEYADWLSIIAGNLGKAGQDFTLMAQNELAEIGYHGSGGSSSMEHKQNPVKAEALVTLARFTATLVSGMHQSLVHEQERSGSAWTLEWMLLPQLVVATGAALRNAIALFSSVQRIG